MGCCHGIGGSHSVGLYEGGGTEGALARQQVIYRGCVEPWRLHGRRLFETLLNVDPIPPRRNKRRTSPFVLTYYRAAATFGGGRPTGHVQKA